jgi:hypothetical protein
MSLTMFLALCVLGLDFMIYALFQWTYGDKRRALARPISRTQECPQGAISPACSRHSQKASLGPQIAWACGNKFTTNLR